MGPRALEQADSQQMDAAQKSPGEMGVGSGIHLQGVGSGHQGWDLELRTLEEEGRGAWRMQGDTGPWTCEQSP